MQNYTIICKYPKKISKKQIQKKEQRFGEMKLSD